MSEQTETRKYTQVKWIAETQRTLGRQTVSTIMVKQMWISTTCIVDEVLRREVGTFWNLVDG